MQFFLCYVFWPAILGVGFSYTAIMHPSQTWAWLAVWSLPWLTWPIGKLRRRQMKMAMDDFEKEAERAGKISTLAAISLSLGPTLVVFLSVWLGILATPIYMEEVMHIDIQAQIEEAQARVQGSQH